MSPKSEPTPTDLQEWLSGLCKGFRDIQRGPGLWATLVHLWPAERAALPESLNLFPEFSPIATRFTGCKHPRPVLRYLRLRGETEHWLALGNLAAEGGRILELLGADTEGQNDDWDCLGPYGRWWIELFEVAWTGRCPMLAAERQVWVPGTELRLPYELETVRAWADSPFLPDDCEIPAGWLKRLPEAFVSEIEDAPGACFHLADMLRREVAQRAGPLTTQRPKNKRGRKPQYSADADAKLIEDWKASGLTRKQFEAARGSEPGEVARASDRSRARKRRKR